MTELEGTFINFIRPHWPVLHSVARQYAFEAGEAQDLVQETLLRAWRSYSSAQESSYRRAWLMVIMRNVACDWQRASAHRPKLLPIPNEQITELSAPDTTEPFAALPAMSDERFREMLHDHVAGALDALDEPFKEVIMLSVAGELSYQEIAEVLDCPVGTVMSRMARARRALRERLASRAAVTAENRKARP